MSNDVYILYNNTLTYLPTHTTQACMERWVWTCLNLQAPLYILYSPLEMQAKLHIQNHKDTSDAKFLSFVGSTLLRNWKHLQVKVEAKAKEELKELVLGTPPDMWP